MAIPEKWLHISPNKFIGHDDIIKRIFGIMDSLGLDRSEVGEYGLNISDKIWIIERGCNILVITETKIYDEVNDYDESNIFTSQHEGSVIKVSNEIISDFLLYVDSVIFEMKALVEIIIKLFDEISLLCYKAKCPILINSLLQLKYEDPL